MRETGSGALRCQCDQTIRGDGRAANMVVDFQFYGPQVDQSLSNFVARILSS